MEKRKAHPARDAGSQKSEDRYRSLLKKLPVGGVVHDFNNLLMAISGYTDLLLARLPENTAVHSYAQQIRKATEKSAELTRQMLGLGNKQGKTAHAAARRAARRPNSSA